jgi:hypothetical protein
MHFVPSIFIVPPLFGKNTIQYNIINREFFNMSHTKCPNKWTKIYQKTKYHYMALVDEDFGKHARKVDLAGAVRTVVEEYLEWVSAAVFRVRVVLDTICQ